jgi:riboflavin biosynthesis pyrimidine reductase
MAIPALEVLFEVDGLPSFSLPDELAAAYGGSLGFEEPRVVANFVETIDGVVSIPSVPKSNRVIAAASEADRFVMGLLRACADAVVIGAGTLAASPRSLWTAEQAFPAAAEGFAELRRRLGKPPEAELVVITRGSVDPGHPGFEAGAVVLTNEAGAERLGGALPPEAIVSVGESVEPTAAIAALHDRGHRLILHEGGPHAIGPFFAARLIDELFLTVSPRLTGRTSSDPRFALVEETDLLPNGPLDARVLGVRRDADHLFLRYEFTPAPR